MRYRSINFPEVRVTDVQESLREFFPDYDDYQPPRRHAIEDDYNIAPPLRVYAARNEERK